MPVTGGPRVRWEGKGKMDVIFQQRHPPSLMLVEHGEGNVSHFDRFLTKG